MLSPDQRNNVRPRYLSMSALNPPDDRLIDAVRTLLQGLPRFAGAGNGEVGQLVRLADLSLSQHSLVLLRASNKMT